MRRYDCRSAKALRYSGSRRPELQFGHVRSDGHVAQRFSAAIRSPPTLLAIAVVICLVPWASGLSGKLRSSQR
jgi:hypothetical protein